MAMRIYRVTQDEIRTRRCVGCGYCCTKARCALSMRLAHGDQNGWCPYLYQEGDRWRCTLAKDPDHAKELAIGEGCCSPLNTDRRKMIEKLAAKGQK